MIFKKVVWGEITVLDLMLAAAIFIAAVVIAKGLTLYIKRILRDRVSKDHLGIIGKIVSYSIYLIGLLSMFAVLGLNLSGLALAGGIAGIVLGFASQSIVGNFVSGLFLIVERPIKIGDAVNIDGMTGNVEDIRIISTTIRSFDGVLVRIPNQTVFTTKMLNYMTHLVRRFEYVVGIRYSDDADKAIGIIKKIIEDHPMALTNPPYQAFVDNLGDNAVNIIVRIWAPVTEWYALKMELLWKIKMSLEKEGIEIAFPQRVVWLANEWPTQHSRESD